MSAEWYQTLREAQRQIVKARELVDHALKNLRCPAKDSGGAQCTADASPEHDHRIREEDMS